MKKQAKETAVLEDQDDQEEMDFEDTEQLSLKEDDNTDNVGDASVEINLDALIEEVEAAGLSTEHFGGHTARKRLDELLEEKRLRKEFSDFDDFEID